jgi:hypothetical protein
VDLAGHELQDLAALIVDTDDAWCFETAILEVPEQRVDIRRPCTGAATDRVADPDGVIQIDRLLHVLDERIVLGPDLVHEYVTAILHVRRGELEVVHAGRVVKRLDFALPD